jgi:SpoVK/Ycf46/Vps4 family AAA+-type ATPase
MGPYVGQTEQKVARMLAVLRALAPVILLMDEFQRLFATGSERDGGTMSRVTAMILNFLQECSDPVYVVATVNNPKSMGMELFYTICRSERFDACFHVDVPVQAARVAMLHGWLKGKIDDPGRAAADLAGRTDRFAGSDLRSVVKRAVADAEYAGEALSLERLREGVERQRMKALGTYEEFAELRRWARLVCEPAGPSDEDETGTSVSGSNQAGLRQTVSKEVAQ